MIFSELVKNPAYSFNMWLAWILTIDQYIIQIYDNKDNSFFSQNLVDICREDVQGNKEAKKHVLILKVAISGPKSSLSFITFTNLHLMIGDGEI